MSCSVLGRIELNHGLCLKVSLGGSGGGDMVRALAMQSRGPEFESTGARAFLSSSINSRVSLIRALERGASFLLFL